MYKFIKKTVFILIRRAINLCLIALITFLPSLSCAQGFALPTVGEEGLGISFLCLANDKRDQILF